MTDTKIISRAIVYFFDDSTLIRNLHRYFAHPDNASGEAATLFWRAVEMHALDKECLKAVSEAKDNSLTRDQLIPLREIQNKKNERRINVAVLHAILRVT
jgi:hypothetical protein